MRRKVKLSRILILILIPILIVSGSVYVIYMLFTQEESVIEEKNYYDLNLFSLENGLMTYKVDLKPELLVNDSTKAMIMSAYQLGLITGAIVAGAIIGLIPLICGIKKKKTNLAIGGLISCILAHFLLGLFFSIPCSIIFTIIIH